MVRIELDSVEAHLVLGAIGDAALTAAVQAAKSRGEVAEYAGIRSSVLRRVSSRIVDQLMPITLTDPVRRSILEDEIALGMS